MDNNGQPAANTRPRTIELRSFRFFDNRQRYLLFLHTCSEKRVVANRIIYELEKLDPNRNEVRLFDAGVGDGTVLTRVMRALHERFASVPHYVVGKEVSLEDMRLALEKLPDRFQEHPSTVILFTNMFYSEATDLAPSPSRAQNLVWREASLRGSSSHVFGQQIEALQPFLDTHWTARLSERSGNAVYDRPVVLVLFREDRRGELGTLIPRIGQPGSGFDLVIASQPYRLRTPPGFKARAVVAPLVRSLRPKGRLIGVHSHGNDPGLEVVQRVWPGENPFRAGPGELLQATRDVLGAAADEFDFEPEPEEGAIFRYDMYALPDETSGTIGTSTLLAAWNAATYVAQIEDARILEAAARGSYLRAVRDVLTAHGGLWFYDEAYVICRHEAPPKG